MLNLAKSWRGVTKVAEEEDSHIVVDDGTQTCIQEQTVYDEHSQMHQCVLAHCGSVLILEQFQL